jgi:flavodoxin
MHTVVIYDTKFGNTEKIAEAIGRGAGAVGSVQVVPTTEARPALAEGPDLVLVGGPTQRRSISPGLLAFFETGLVDGILVDVLVSSFDTRYKGSTWIMGSAAAEAAKHLGKAGALLVAKPESFFMHGGGPMERQVLEAGELERAEAWGRTVATSAVRAAAAA